MGFHGCCQGFREVQLIARPSLPTFRPKKTWIHGNPTTLVFPCPSSFLPSQAVKDDSLSREFHTARDFSHRKRTTILANSYSRGQGSREDSARNVETPGDGTLDKNPASQTATVNGDERASNRANSVEEIGKELNELRKEKLGGEPTGEITTFWKGVLEETAQIEWPSFRKVLGTTGVVLAVIIGSSVVLLTVNAIFAEISDKVFDGIGLQDIIGGFSKG